MTNLNKGWMGLIAAGVFFLLGFAVLNIIESVSGGKEEFFFSIQQFPTNQLLTTPLEEHLRAGIADAGTLDTFTDNQE